MKVEYKEDYLSITKFQSIEIPDFCILTGPNGAGKSHLLAAIEQGKILLEGIDAASVVRFSYEDFRLNQQGEFSGYQIESEKENAWQLFTNNGIRKKLIDSEKILGEHLNKLEEIAGKENTGFWFLTKEDIADQQMYEELISYKKTVDQFFSRKTNLGDNQQARAIFAMVKNRYFHPDSITWEKFHDLYRPYDFINDFLPLQLGKIIWEYYIRYSRNKYNLFSNKTEGTSNIAIPEEEFERLNGKKPWDVINGILERFGSIDYRINIPEGSDPYGKYLLRLKHKNGVAVEIDFSNLSSGEKVLMALVASIYKASYDKHFPNLLLLDEIDASLHPSMIQNLLDTINEIFLAQNMKVILVTHSPTTIALAPESSIFVMEKSGEDRLIKSSKNEALSILTEGFATLDEGIRLFDQFSKKTISVITEGHNVAYIETAIKLFAPHLIPKVDVINGIEGKSGKTQLMTLFEFLSRVPHKNYVVFVWDCDMDREIRPSGNTIPYVFERNKNNNKISAGIENLFSETLFKDEFFDKKSKQDGYHVTLNKKVFRDFILENGRTQDYINFRPFIAELEKLG
jgi:predicted ATP-binding protein involved in virulence